MISESMMKEADCFPSSFSAQIVEFLEELEPGRLHIRVIVDNP